MQWAPPDLSSPAVCGTTKGLSSVHLEAGRGCVALLLPFVWFKWVSAGSALPCLPGCKLTPPILNGNPISCGVFLGSTWFLRMGKVKEWNQNYQLMSKKDLGFFSGWGWPHELWSGLPFDWGKLQALGLKVEVLECLLIGCAWSLLKYLLSIHICFTCACVYTHVCVIFGLPVRTRSWGMQCYFGGGED